MIDRSAYLTKIGTALPQYQYRQEELAGWMAKRLNADEAMQRKMKVLYKMTRIENRHSVLPDFSEIDQDFRLFDPADITEPLVENRMAVYHESVMDLSIAAIKDTIGELDDLDTISHLITVSCTGLSAPGLELKLKEALPFKNNLQTHAVNFVGCYAFFPALKMAEAFCKSDPNSKVLIICTEICTIHFQNSGSEDHLLSNSLFADGSAACLVQGESLPRDSQRALRLEQTAQLHYPKGKKDMAWDIHSSGFLMKLSAYVPDLVDQGIGDLLHLLNEHVGMESKFDQWAIHPGGRKILEVCSRELQLDENDLWASYAVLKEVGNLSAPTILFVIKKLWKQGESDKQLFACGFGPGLTLDGAVFKWIDDA